MSRTIKFAQVGGPEVLEFIEMEVPAPGPNEVRIKVKAIGINRAESMCVMTNMSNRQYSRPV
jgi:NADPH:quinone reductase-like Zn-dependent oxidoreductase